MMLKTHEKFHSANGKRLILIVDDEEINRELLKIQLADRFDLLFAEDGQTALTLVRENRDTLSLILLDLLMPGMHGFDVLRAMKADDTLRDIPVIVLTADREAEVESLQLGASDFLSKPYPDRQIILARIMHSIELSEDRDIIQSTERDPITNLYNREYFFRYAQQYDQHHRDAIMDAVLLDIHHFHMINERYGRSCGDDILRAIAGGLVSALRPLDGIVCRREGDTFLAYFPHQTDYSPILTAVDDSLEHAELYGLQVRYRVGVYPDCDKSIDIEHRFDRAKIASDSLRGNFMTRLAMYDSGLHETHLFREQLLGDFQEALDTNQFQVYLQPKFDIRPKEPRLAGAEALVRWKHPRLGMVSPGVFIPLFEENGLVQRLDLYVWREAARLTRGWKERYELSVPVSVNVSRVDMFDPALPDVFQGILEEFGLSPADLHLEVTESAYTTDSSQVIAIVNRLRKQGFFIEMDDFGTGYSSLNMISTLPIDALKLDMKFIQNASRDNLDTRLIELIIDIADYLSVPVIAEGVETLEQLQALKDLGCAMVQGYYFSRPVPAEEYEGFLRELLAQMEKEASQSDLSAEELRAFDVSRQSMVTFSAVAKALAADYFSIYYVNTEDDTFIEFSAHEDYNSLGIEKSGKDFFNLSRKNILRVVHPEDHQKILNVFHKENILRELDAGNNFTLDYRLVFNDVPAWVSMKAAYLPGSDPVHLVIGVNNIDAQMRRQKEFEAAWEKTMTYSRIAQALSRDYYSIYIVNTDNDEFVEYSSSEDYNSLQVEQSGKNFFEDCRRNVMRLVYRDDLEMALSIWDKSRLMPELEEGRTFSATYRLVMDGVPVYINCKVISLEPEEGGNYIVIGISNVDAQMRRERELVIAREKANRDPLTGVKSKHAYVDVCEDLREEIAGGTPRPFAVAVCDVNNLKAVNDSRGHQAGDMVIREAAHIICEIFKHSPVFRTGGDEFVVIMHGRDFENQSELLRQMDEANELARAIGGSLVACGISNFNPETDSSVDDVFARADQAMYQHKSAIKESMRQ